MASNFIIPCRTLNYKTLNLITNDELIMCIYNKILCTVRNTIWKCFTNNDLANGRTKLKIDIVQLTFE